MEKLAPIFFQLWLQLTPKRRLQLAGLFFLMIAGAIAELASLGLVFPFLAIITNPENFYAQVWAQPFVEFLAIKSPSGMLLPITIAFGCAAIFSGAVRLALLWLQTSLGNAIGNDLGSEVFRRILYQPYSFHLKQNSSEVVALLMTKINTVVNFVITPALILVTSGFMVFVIVGFLVYINPLMMILACLGFAVIYLSIALSTKEQLTASGKIISSQQSKVANTVQEGLGGIRDVLIYGLQEEYSKIFQRADLRLRKAFTIITIIGGATRPTIEALGLVVIITISYFMVGNRDTLDLVVPVLGVLALAAQRILPLAQQIYLSWSSILGGGSSLFEVMKILQAPIYLPSTARGSLCFSHEIGIKNLSFRYGPNEPWILKNINLNIPKGICLGIVGPTGGGKSTFLDVIMGLLLPTSGVLSVDNTQITQENLLDFQGSIAHVPQAIYLSDASILENIAFGIPIEEIERNRVFHAANCAQISSEINSWVDGYNTVVGERGVRISGGQRQRIGVARALYRGADILIFDEATSALDEETERSLIASIHEHYRGVTIIMVAHRLTTLKNCDLLIELKSGGISPINSYENLARKE